VSDIHIKSINISSFLATIQFIRIVRVLLLSLSSSWTYSIRKNCIIYHYPIVHICLTKIRAALYRLYTTTTTTTNEWEAQQQRTVDILFLYISTPIESTTMNFNTAPCVSPSEAVAAGVWWHGWGKNKYDDRYNYYKEDVKKKRSLIFYKRIKHLFCHHQKYCSSKNSSNSDILLLLLLHKL